VHSYRDNIARRKVSQNGLDHVIYITNVFTPLGCAVDPLTKTPMDAFNLSTWPPDMTPDWFSMVTARATIPQSCKTAGEAQKWEETALSRIKINPYAVSPISDRRHQSVWLTAGVLD
jgi:hypothetical protein